MQYNEDEWLDEKINKDLQAMADKREKMLMESEALADIDMPRHSLDRIHHILDEEQGILTPRQPKKFRFRPSIMVASILVLCLGFGVVSTGNKLYVPEILRRESGNEETTKINNAEALARFYNEDDVCQEIEEKLGVIPVRLGYRPKNIQLTGYLLDTTAKYSIMEYEFGMNRMHVYVSKDLKNSSIDYKIDGTEVGTITVESCGKDVVIYLYQEMEGQDCFEMSMEYLNTYYSISGRMEQTEFEKIIENIIIKND